MKVTIHGKEFKVTKRDCETQKGTKYRVFELQGPRATYFTCTYVNHPGRHFILDCKGKVSNVFRNVDLIEQADGSLAVA
jgi:hypothetical protein